MNFKLVFFQSTTYEDAKSIQAQLASMVAMLASDLPQSDLPQPHRIPPVQQPTPQTPTESTTSSGDAKHMQAKFASKVAMVASPLPQSLPKSTRPQHPVPSQSLRIPSPSVSPVAVNTHPHDIKQWAPSRPAMAASPQQGILPNQPNPGGPPIMNMGPERFQAPRQALPRGYQVNQQNHLGNVARKHHKYNYAHIPLKLVLNL